MRDRRRRGGASVSPSTVSGFGDVGAVLEVVLQDLGGQGWTQFWALGSDGADYLSAAQYLGCGQTGDFRGQYEVDLHLCVGLEELLGQEEESGAADVFRGPRAPTVLSEQAIAQREMEVEAARAERGNLCSCEGGGIRRGARGQTGLAGNRLGVQYFPDLVFEGGKAEGFLQQVDAGIEHAVVSNGILGVARHVEHTHVGELGGDLACQLAAIHSGHDDVGQQEIDYALMAGYDLQGGSAIFGLEDLV